MVKSDSQGSPIIRPTKGPETMKKLIRAAAMLCLAAVLHAQPPAPAAPASPPLVIVNANLVNVRNGRVTPNASIVIRNGRIESMGSGPRPRSGQAHRPARALST